MTYRTQAEAYDALDVLDAYVHLSQSGAPQKITGVSNQVIASGGFLGIQMAADDYFSALSLPITYTFTWNGGALPAWLTYDPVAYTLTGQSPAGTVGTFIVRRTASVTSGGQTYTSYDEFSVAITSAAPVVIGQPAARSFPEGVATAFTVNVASFFAVDPGAGTPVYEVLNDDETALTGYVVNSITAGIASLTSPTTGSGLKTILFKVTVNGLSAKVTADYTVVANPLPQVISSVSDISIDISQAGNLPLSGGTIFSDTESLSYSLVNADGTSAPAGYSWDGVNIAYPIEGGAATRSFRLKATETGALARSVTSAAFTFDRPLAQVVIVTAADVAWPENATTVRRIDVRTILGTDAGEDITIPSSLVAKITKQAVGSGVFDLTGVFGNNDILSGTATYVGTASSVPQQANPTFSSIHNPPVIPTISINAVVGAPITIDVVAQSDDPTNLIQAGSVSSNIGSATLSADRKSITIDLGSSQANVVTVDYILTAPDGSNPLAGTLSVDFISVTPPQIVAPITSTSTDGTAFTPFSIRSFFSAGSHALDFTQAQFYDSQGVTPLGKTINITGSGTFSLDNSGNASFTGIAGWVGSTALYIVVPDINGNQSAANPWTHTQQAAPISPPPPDPNAIFPNTQDGKPIIVRGLEPASHFQATALMFKNKRHLLKLEGGAAGSNSNWSTNLYTLSQKIERGEFTPATGWMTLSAGESMRFRTPRFIQLSAEGSHTNLLQGLWAWTLEYASGQQPSVTQGAGWSVDPSPPTNRLRFTKTLDNSTGGSENFTVAGPGRFRMEFIGLASDESGWAAAPIHANFLADMAMDKVHRCMDLTETNGHFTTRADDWIRDDDYIPFGAAFFGAPLAANHDQVRIGGDIKLLAKIVVSINRSLWLNMPGALGSYVTDGDPGGWVGTRDDAALDPYWPQIFAAAKIEYRKLAQRWIASLIAAGYPDNTIIALEFQNECWNFSFRIAKYCTALQNHLNRQGKVTQSTRGGSGAGYLAHLAFREFAQVISEQKPNQQVKFVLGAQTATNPFEWSRGAVNGWYAYAADNPSGALPISRLAFSTTGYLSDGHKWSGAGQANAFGASDETSWSQAYNNARLVSENNLFGIVKNWYVDPSHTTPGVNSSVYGAIADNERHRAFCQSVGCEWLGQYEGSYHENLRSGELIQSQGLMTAAQRRQVIRNFINHQTGYDVQKLFLQEMYARYPNAWVANYYKYHSSGHIGNPWFEKNFNDLGTLVPNTAAAAWEEFATSTTTTPPPPTPTPTAPLDEDFETNNTIGLLQSAGWSFQTGYNVVSDASQNSIYNPTDHREATKQFRNPNQAIPNLVLRLKFRGVSGNPNTYFQLRGSATNSLILIKPNGAGELEFWALYPVGVGATETLLFTTSGLGATSGYVDAIFSCFFHPTSGTASIVDAVSSTVYGSFSGNTNPAGVSSPHIDTFVLRGRTYLAEIEDMTP